MSNKAALIRAIVDSYENINPYSCCSYGFVTNDDNLSIRHLLHVCHARLTLSIHSEYDQLLTSFPVKDDVDLKFFDFMKNVLYRKWSKYIHLEQTKDEKFYIRIDRLSEVPANIVMNFCICSRIVVERRWVLNNWHKLVLKGVHPSFALAVCRCSADFEKEDFLDQTIKSAGSDFEHWPFYLVADMNLLITADPINISSNFKSSPGAALPTNVLWGDAKSLRGLLGSTLREFWIKWKKQLNLSEEITE